MWVIPRTPNMIFMMPAVRLFLSFLSCGVDGKSIGREGCVDLSSLDFYGGLERITFSSIDRVVVTTLTGDEKRGGVRIGGSQRR